MRPSYQSSIMFKFARERTLIETIAMELFMVKTQESHIVEMGKWRAWRRQIGTDSITDHVLDLSSISKYTEDQILYESSIYERMIDL